MELTKHEQLAAFDQYRELLFERMVQEIVDNREVILDIARERVEWGFEMYGSTMWGWGAEELTRNRFEEYADGVVYTLPAITRYVIAPPIPDSPDD